ncbi:hypothetical protein [Halomarina pelagica]|uniref:hypothetical protein n=1 Tax=Halomarina pelagica TaxID=2961599 RepID=UPI0020C4C4D3|nr:hypothetical protein [Halomarina sp. BND7]
MPTHEITAEDCTDYNLAQRDVRALTEYLLVVAEAPDLYVVYGEGGDEYTVDARTGACTCPDDEYRQPTGGCKHVRRVAFETGARDVPTWAHRTAMDPLLVEALAEHEEKGEDETAAGAAVEGETETETAMPTIATDGGELVIVGDDEEVLDGSAFTESVEPLAQGGERYVRCEGCGRELLIALGGRDALLHTEGCPNAKREDDGQ